LSSKGARNPVACSSSFTKKGYIYDNLTTHGMRNEVVGEFIVR